MTGKVIIPPNYIDIQGPLIFLGGPIQGAPNWHNKAIPIIWEIDRKINIASPNTNIGDKFCAGNTAEFREPYRQDEWEQVDWESFYLKRAAENGANMFWFPLETNHYCDRPYAQTSRVEVGEWMTKHLINRCNVVVGFQRGFSGEKYLKYRLKKECPNILICSTLEETCRKTIEKIKA